MIDKNGGFGMVEEQRTVMDTKQIVDRGRNYHVKKLLNHLGGRDVPPYLQKAIKRSFSEFAQDITNKRTEYNDGHEDYCAR